MAFGSLVFLFLFLPVVVGCNWVMQERYRPAFITLASIVFFAFFSFSGVAVLIAIAIANFIFARLIVVAQSRNRLLLSRWVLAGGLLFDMALLAYFKWSGFIDPYINAIMHRDKGSPVAPFLMLVGMSFIVFSAVTYLVDVWRGDSKPGRLFDLIHYLFFFPKIVSGPIVRFQDFVRTRPRSENVIWGAQRVVLGLAKKVLIADNLGAVVNGTF
ncbi:MAG: hypothetical protein Q4P05_08280, partial [Actinomycetaceae bacterium]|nr:hypothetical protein [Actinomycetaceae bacterium]